MRTLHTYLTRQMLATLAMAVAVFTFLLLLGIVLKEVLTLLVSRQVPPGLVLRAIGLLIPYVLAFAMPMGLLTAALLVFGRFSADQELTAARANGVSLLALITPVLLLSVVMSLVCASINLQLAPQCRAAYKDLLFRMGMERPDTLIAEGRFVTDFPGYVIYVGNVEGARLEEVLIYQLDPQERVQSYVYAAEGNLTREPTNRVLQLRLTNAQITTYAENRLRPSLAGEVTYPLQFGPMLRAWREPKVSELTFPELWLKRRELDRMGVDSTPVQVVLHREVSFSFACISFTLVGIPLGIRAHRRETSFGVAAALALVLLYYSLILLGQGLKTRPEWMPHLIVWAPNFIFQIMGIILLWRANRGL
jgi:lipopolysaccharide export system permease protein